MRAWPRDARATRDISAIAKMAMGEARLSYIYNMSRTGSGEIRKTLDWESGKKKFTRL